MHKKALAVVICLLFLPTISIVHATTEPASGGEEEPQSIFGWTIVRGLVFNLQKMGNDLVFRAIRVHYTEITGCLEVEQKAGISRNHPKSGK